jgi:hypothetical protein
MELRLSLVCNCRSIAYRTANDNGVAEGIMTLHDPTLRKLYDLKVR